MNAKWIVGLSVAAVLGTGCSARVGDFTALSTRNVKLAGKRAASRVKGESCDKDILGFTYERKDMKKAVERALESAGANYDALVDVTVDSTWFETIIYGSNCIVVEGTAVSSTEQ
jgi:hypothetical protein